MSNNLIVTQSPHIETDDHIIRRMWAVFFSALPAGVASVYIFGVRALYVIGVSTGSCIITEFFIQKLRTGKTSIGDGSSLVTGLLFAYTLPPGVPLWVAFVGGFVSISIGKQIFGGLGFNIFNPALVGRAFVMASWPSHLTSWSNPRWMPDAVSAATPLGILKEELPLNSHHLPDYWNLFLGNHGGSLGEVCIAALLIGALYLLIKGYISWQIPFSFILTLGLFSWAFSGKGLFSGDFIFAILTGGVILGAFFMATDYVTAPLTRKGKAVFGFGCGLLTFVIRKWSGYPEGVCYAILMMNLATPLIDRFTRPKKLGLTMKA